MKKRLLSGLVALCLLLTGCASLLERDYVDITNHNTTITAEGDPSVLRAENYQELVNALMFFITQQAETGTIRLYSDAGTVESDLEAACLEVIQEDPLGAYSVDYIKHSVKSIVTYSEADVQITYRRTPEQIDSIVSATGAIAIRSELAEALSAFSPELVLRIGFFDKDEDYIRSLCREAFLSAPATALTMPEVSVSIYPDSGRQRIVELILTYDLSLQELQSRKELLAQECERLLMALSLSDSEQSISTAAQMVLDRTEYDIRGDSTAYHALVDGRADSLGLSLAVACLYERLGIDFKIVEGSLDGDSHCWLLVFSDKGWTHLDPSASASFLSDDQMENAGYFWDRDAFPPAEYSDTEPAAQSDEKN